MVASRERVLPSVLSHNAISATSSLLCCGFVPETIFLVRPLPVPRLSLIVTHQDMANTACGDGLVGIEIIGLPPTNLCTSLLTLAHPLHTRHTQATGRPDSKRTGPRTPSHSKLKDDQYVKKPERRPHPYVTSTATVQFHAVFRVRVVSLRVASVTLD